MYSSPGSLSQFLLAAWIYFDLYPGFRVHRPHYSVFHTLILLNRLRRELCRSTLNPNRVKNLAFAPPSGWDDESKYSMIFLR